MGAIVMSIRRQVVCTAVMLVLLGCVAFSQAAIISNPPGSIVTLDAVNQAGGIIVGDKLFDSFRVDTISSVGNPYSPDTSTVGVAGAVNGNGDLGLVFQGPFIANAGQILDTRITFRVTVLDQTKAIEDLGLKMSLYGSIQPGSVAIAESAFDADPDLGGNAVFAPPMLVKYDPVNNILVDTAHTTFFNNTTYSQLWISKDIIVSGGFPATTGFSMISNFYQYFSQTDNNVPEPASLALFAIGGAMLVTRRRKAAKA